MKVQSYVSIRKISQTYQSQKGSPAQTPPKRTRKPLDIRNCDQVQMPSPFTFQKDRNIEILEKHKLERQRDASRILQLQNKVEQLQLELELQQDEEKTMNAPVCDETALRVRIRELENHTVSYIEELNKLSDCLKEVVEQNKFLTQAYLEKCNEIEQLRRK